MFESKISFHTFLCLYQTKTLRIWPMETRDMPKELGLFYVILLTDPLYIHWDTFIILHVILTIQYHQVISNFMLVFNMLHLNLLKIVILLTLKVVPGYHPARIEKN